MQRITSTTVTRTCAICERSLLLGERAIRFAPNGVDFVDVCPLCQEQAVEYGWLKEGSPTSPTVPEARRKRRRLGSIFETRRPPHDAPVASEPILRRLSEPELAMVEAADLFNASQYRRTVGGIAKSLGQPRASIVSALRGQVGARRHDRLGHLLVPVPRQPRVGPAGPPRGAGSGSAGARVVVRALERAPRGGRKACPRHRSPLARTEALPTIRA